MNEQNVKLDGKTVKLSEVKEKMETPSPQEKIVRTEEGSNNFKTLKRLQG
jgi:hypothetical protein